MKGVIKDLGQLVKFRLSMLVLFSGGMGFFMGWDGVSFDWLSFLAFLLGGFLLTGASNAANQILERDLDALMERTKNRPLPSGRLKLSTAILATAFFAVSGSIILVWFVNVEACLLTILSMVLYAFVYTPLKQKSPIAVLVGAVPGALPPMIGWVAATGSFGVPALVLFAIQFIWQFPHFWSIAWILNDDYKRAGFYLLPAPGGPNKRSAFHLFFYSLFLLPIAVIPYKIEMVGVLGAVGVFLAGLAMVYYAFMLLRSSSQVSAKKLMFASFFYLPLVQIFLMIDKL